jgi:hypothetical protein
MLCFLYTRNCLRALVAIKLQDSGVAFICGRLREYIRLLLAPSGFGYFIFAYFLRNPLLPGGCCWLLT